MGALKDYNFLKVLWYGEKDSYIESRGEYYENNIFPKSIANIHKIFDVKNKLNAESELQFKKVKFGASTKEVINMLGKPRYDLYPEETNNYFIFFYKEKYSSHNVLVQLHFYNNKFFYASYAFRKIKTADSDIIKKTFLEKCANGTEIVSNLPIAIVDSHKNKVLITEDIFFRISFLSGERNIDT